MSFDLSALGEAVARHGRVARVVVAEAKGSAPREAGAAMLVWLEGQSGTIGGGALEFEAVARAREILAESLAVAPHCHPLPTGGSGAAGGEGGVFPAAVDRLALGPNLQQCCGGAVTLLTEVWDAERLAALDTTGGLAVRPLWPTGPDMPLAIRRRRAAARGQGAGGGPTLMDGWAIEPLAAATRAIWVWGAGHVGRAIVAVLAPLPGVAIIWVDTAAERFPDAVPEGVDAIVAADPAILAPFAPAGAEHLILTYSHALDLALCHALLGHGFRSCGLIGSRTKWTRFSKRLTELGHTPDSIRRIDCPIGDPALGKHPQAIAVSVAAQVLRAGAERARKEGAA